MNDAEASWAGGHFEILSLLFVRCKLYYRVKNGVRVRRVYRRLACRVASTSVTAVNGEHSVDVEEECLVEWRACGRKNATKHAAKC